MPDSRRGDRETDRETDGKPSNNIISLISKLADDNLTIVRNISTGLAVVGVIVIARSIKLVTKFCTVSEIPARFIEKHVSLRGRVHNITESGLEVEHVPIYIPLLSPLLSERVCASPLTVQLAGVELTPEGRTWLKEHLRPAQMVGLRLISREEETLHCLVSLSTGLLWSRCVNEDVLKLGLARTVPICGLAPDSHLRWRLHKRLLRAEGKAERKGLGFWKEDSLSERVSQVVKDNILVRLIRRLFKQT